MFALLDAALLTATIMVADRVPSVDLESYCRRIASHAAPVGDPLACLRQEQEARAQLLAQWTQFPTADRSYCRELTTLGGDPTFTELLTCLELRRDARRLREKDQETTGSPPASEKPR